MTALRLMIFSQTMVSKTMKIMVEDMMLILEIWAIPQVATWTGSNRQALRGRTHVRAGDPRMTTLSSKPLLRLLYVARGSREKPRRNAPLQKKRSDLLQRR